jgi:cold shock CspA family protein
MRIEGTLAKWNDDRGFGFIRPTQGGPEVFAHVSAFPRDGQRPRLGER